MSKPLLVATTINNLSPDEPSEPKDVMITDLNDESVVLSWKQPEKIGDGDLIGYIVERCV